MAGLEGNRESDGTKNVSRKEKISCETEVMTEAFDSVTMLVNIDCKRRQRLQYKTGFDLMQPEGMRQERGSEIDRRKWTRSVIVVIVVDSPKKEGLGFLWFSFGAMLLVPMLAFCIRASVISSKADPKFLGIKQQSLLQSDMGGADNE